jgi:hypothetical protein
VEQLRKRIYITKREQTFLTITLDYVSSKYKDKSFNFVELELELNEICYTESDSLTRVAMEKITSDIKSDLMAKFPSIKQDQTPKYNKSANALGIDIKKIKQSNKNFVRITLIIGCCCILLIVVIVILRKRNRKKPKSLIRF